MVRATRADNYLLRTRRQATLPEDGRELEEVGRDDDCEPGAGRRRQDPIVASRLRRRRTRPSQLRWRGPRGRPLPKGPALPPISPGRHPADHLLPDATPVTWSDADQLGPEPRPPWLVVDDASAVDLGILKSGKEADVHVVRWTAKDPAARPAECLLAVKRYRPGDRHHAPYRSGRQALGRFTRLAAGGWGELEYALLAHLWSAGVSVPYPVSRTGDELVMELIGDAETGVAAPRLAAFRPAGRHEVAALWEQARALVLGIAEAGVAHGDLSAYNVLVHDGRLVAIDMPQAVDLVANPLGLDILHRDCVNLAGWFRRRGLSEEQADPDDLFAAALGVLPWA